MSRWPDFSRLRAEHAARKAEAHAARAEGSPAAVPDPPAGAVFTRDAPAGPAGEFHTPPDSAGGVFHSPPDVLGPPGEPAAVMDNVPEPAAGGDGAESTPDDAPAAPQGT